jgi:hypothetical protein
MIRRLLVILVLCGSTFVGLGVVTPANAIPGITDCKDAPTPQMPGRGFAGSIDPGPTTHDPNATSVYETVQYPPPWHTYDLGCGGALRDGAATLDTTIGNWIKGFATSLVALCNSMHRFVSPPTFLDKLDPLVAKGTSALRDAIYLQWVALSMLILGVFIIVSARGGNLPSAVETIMWALFVMGLIATVISYPLLASHVADDLATSTVGEVNARMLNEHVTDADPSSARAAVLTDNVLYKQWLQGELGSADSTVAMKYGRTLLAAQTYTYAEAKVVNEVNNSLVRDAITATKKQNFKDIAAKIEHEDPDAYSHLQGKSGSRSGAAAWSALAALITIPFMAFADFLIVLGLLIIRVTAIVLPALGPLLIHRKLRHVTISIGKIVAAALINMVFFAVGAAINALVVGVMLGGSTGLPFWANLLICLAISVLLWGGLRPFRKLTTMVSASSVTQGAVGAITMQNTRRNIKKVAGVATGVWAGARVANLDREDDAPVTADVAPEVGNTPQTPRTEGQVRPQPSQPQSPRSSNENIRDIYDERVVARPAPATTYVSLTPPAAPAQPVTPELASAVSDTPSLPAANVRPAPPGTPEIGTPTSKVPDKKTPDVYAADHPLPTNIVRADPILKDGTTVYRIWDPETKDVITVDPFTAGSESME